MTELAKELIEDIAVGDYIKLRYGTDIDQVEHEGIIQKISENFMTLQQKDGIVSKIRLDDNLRSLTRLSVSDLSKNPHDSKADEKKPVVDEPAQTDSLPEEPQIQRQFIKLIPSQLKPISIKDTMEKARKYVKQAESTDLKKILNGVLDSLFSAYRCQAIEYKYHNLRAKVINAKEACLTENDFFALYYCLGIIAYTAKDYEYSLEPFVRIGAYSLASQIAKLCDLSSSAQVYTLCAVLSKEINDVSEDVSDILTARHDIAALLWLLDEHKSEDAFCEKLASCAKSMFSASGAKLNRTIVVQDSAYDSAITLIQAIPQEWQKKPSALHWWSEFSKYRFPCQSLSVAAQKTVGKISYFDANSLFGFINNKIYFSVSKVRDDTKEGLLLRRLLFGNRWKNCKVTFQLEVSVGGSKDRVAWVEASIEGESASDNLVFPVKCEHKNGSVVEFNAEKKQGLILSNGKKFFFNLNGIIDPWLKDYYERNFAPREQDVTFDADGKTAYHICWSNPSPEDHDATAKNIGKEDIQRFRDYQEVVAKQSKLNNPNVDPYKEYPFIDSSAAVSSSIASMPLLTWNGKSLIEGGTQKQIQSDKRPAAKVVEKPIPLMPIQGMTNRSFADRGRKEAQMGHLESAAEAFEKSLRDEGFNESVVCDFISLRMRQEGGIDKAIELLQQYEKQFTPEKRLNIRIQVYDKKKDYSALIPLYEETFRTSNSIPKKSHSLIRLIDAYIKLEQYNEALSVCKRWEQFYAQNQISSYAEKLRNAIAGINRNKAICLYFLGNLEEAKKIAIELVRANPKDTAANQILDGTLRKYKSDEDESGIENLVADEFDDFDEDVTMDSSSQMSRFVRMQVQQTDIAAVLKTSNVKDGRYCGSSKDGLEDVKRIVGRMIGMTAQTRSASLFAACKILEQIEQRGDIQIKNSYRKYRFTGRAMASWGDFMVSQASQLDTPRMGYLYALKILVPLKQQHEQDWTNAYNRYIKSFFLARVGSNSLEEYIHQQNSKRAKDPANTDVFLRSRIQPVLLPEFLVGLLMIIQAIQNQEDRSTTFINDLFSKNSELRESVIQQIGVMLDKDLRNSISKSEFSTVLMTALETMTEKQRTLNQRLIDFSSTILSEPLSIEQIALLEADNWKNYLTATDLNRLNRIHYIIRRSLDYFGSRDFENRADCLRAIIHESEALLQAIQKEPTDISYDVFLPSLEQIVLRANDKQVDLYTNFLPKLSIAEKIKPFRTHEGQIQVQLTINNEANYQSADSLSITSVSSPDITRFDCEEVIDTLRGGDDTEIGLQITVAEKALSSGSFTATICCSYKCSDAPQNVIVKNEDLEFTFIIPNENYEPLVNPYIAYEGKVMDNASMFFGRTVQIQQILEMIRPQNAGTMNYGRAIAMYGQTRTGKSSLMYHLKNKLIKCYGDDILIWDIKNIGELPESAFMENLLYTIMYTGNSSILENPSLNRIIAQQGLEPPLKEIRTTPSLAQSYFNEYMSKLNIILKKEKKIIILLIDEFTYLHNNIKTGVIPNDFMKFWKALLQNYCIFAIVAGQDDMPEFMREYQNEFACMEAMKLTYLDEQDAKKLIRQPLEKANHEKSLFSDDDSVNLLYELTAGSAYLTIILCSKLVTYLNEIGAYTITKGIIHEFLRTRAFGPNGFLTEVNFESQLQERGHRELDNINHDILLAVARLSQTTGFAKFDQIEALGLSKDDLHVYIDRLVDRNVLVKEGRDQYRIQVNLLERWLISTRGA